MAEATPKQKTNPNDPLAVTNDLTSMAPEAFAQLQQLQADAHAKELEVYRQELNAKLNAGNDNVFSVLANAANIKGIVEAKAAHFQTQQQADQAAYQIAAQKKQEVNDTIAAIGAEMGASAVDIKRAQDVGGFENVGKEMKAFSEGQVANATKGSQVALAAANVSKTVAETAQSQASAAASMANANKTNIEATGAQIDNARKLQPKEGDFIIEKQFDGTTRRIQMGKMPDGMALQQNSDGTYTTIFDISKDQGANKAAFDKLQTDKADIANKQRDISQLQQLTQDLANMGVGEVGETQVAAAEAKRLVGQATAQDNKILAYNAASKGLSMFGLKTALGAQFTQREGELYMQINGSITSPKLRRDWTAAYASGSLEAATAATKIQDAAIAQGVAPAKAAIYAQNATKFMAGTSVLKNLLRTGNAELIRNQYKVLRQSGADDATIQSRLGDDAKLLANYL